MFLMFIFIALYTVCSFSLPYSILLYEQITFYLFITIKKFHIHYIVDRHLGCCQFLAIMSTAAINILIQAFCCIGASVSVGVCLGVELLGVMINAKVTLKIVLRQHFFL